MGIVQRFERKLEDVVGDAFARVFGGSIVPQEVQAALRREAADGVRSAGQGRLLAPNEYVVLLSTGDLEKATDDSDLNTDTFAEHLREYVRDQGWQTYGEVVVRFEQSPSLHTGQFRARGVVNPDTQRDRTHQAPSTPDPQPGAPMTDNPGPQQGRPGEEYGREDDRYGRPDQEPRGQQPPQGEGYPPRQGGYEGGGYGQGGHQQDYGRPPQQGGYDQGGYQQRPPQQGGYDQPGRGGGYDQGGYSGPPQGGGDYGRPPAPPQGGGYGAPQQGGYGEPPRPNYGEYEQGGYGASPQGGGYGSPQGPPSGQDYGRPPQQGGGYGAPPQQGGYGSPQGGYGEPEYGGDYEHGGYQSSPDYGAPAASPSGGRTNVTLQLDDGSGRTYQLREGTNVIGRGQDAQFRLPDTGVSRRHLEVRFDGHAALLSDLNSTNGTTVNNAPVTEWQLADGDIIRLGHSEIIVRVQ
ncbi:MAG: FhaA domain-containing protein [Mycobacterium sp.]